MMAKPRHYLRRPRKRLLPPPLTVSQIDDLNTEGANATQFFHINGVIRQRVEGLSLDDLLSEINIWLGGGGVIGDCRPGKVIVRVDSGIPVIYGFVPP